MVQEVTRFTTVDGSVFDSMGDAQAHETFLSIKPEIEAFLDEYYPLKAEGRNGPSRSIAQTALTRWLSKTRSA